MIKSVYVLRIFTKKPKNNEIYIGFTVDLKKTILSTQSWPKCCDQAWYPLGFSVLRGIFDKRPSTKREFRLKHHGRGLVELKKRIGFC